MISTPESKTTLPDIVLSETVASSLARPPKIAPLQPYTLTFSPLSGPMQLHKPSRQNPAWAQVPGRTVIPDNPSTSQRTASLPVLTASGGTQVYPDGLEAGPEAGALYEGCMLHHAL